MRRNPLVGSYVTSDGRYLVLCCLQAAHYWPEMCRIIGHPDLATDPRFTVMPALLENSGDAVDILARVMLAPAERSVVPVSSGVASPATGPAVNVSKGGMVS